jgi:hypothetical protein
MKKESKGLLLALFLTLVIGGGVAWAGVTYMLPHNTPAPAPQTPVAPTPTTPVAAPSTGLVYVDMTGNLMDKSKFATSSANAYAGIPSQSVLVYDITKNPQNDPRTNLAAVPDFQIVSDGTTKGKLSATKQGIAGHTYVYFFENTTGSYYDVTGTFTVPANINPFAPSFDIGNILAPAVGTLKLYNESGIQTDNAADEHAMYNETNGNTVDSVTLTTELKISVGSQTYGEFVRIWGEYSATGLKSAVIGISAVQKAGPSIGVNIDSSDEKNPIITINELTSQYPVTFTYYIQDGAMGTQANTYYTIYADDWNAVPGKFASKVGANLIFTST